MTDSFPSQIHSDDRRIAVVSGTRWTSFGEVVSQILRVVTYVLLARLLAPRDFGLLAMALVITNFIDVIRDLGTRSAIIQKRDVSRELASSIFILNIGIAVVVTAVLVAIAPLVGELFETPDVIPVLRVMCIAIGIGALGLVQQGLLYRAMQFSAIAVALISGAVSQAIVALTMGALGFGVWALVAGIISGAFVTTLLLWIASGWRPFVHFAWSDIRGVASFSLNVTGVRVLNFFVNDVDKFVVGRALGAAALGIYSMGWRIVSQILTVTGRVLQQVLFPTLSAIQDDNEKVRRDFLRTMSVVALVFFPIMVGIATVADVFVRVVLGADWIPAIPLMTILALLGPIQISVWGASILFQAKGRADWMLRWRIVSGLAIVAAYFVGVRWGLNGVVLAFAAVVVALAYPSLAIPFRLIRLRFREFAMQMAPYILACAAMGSVVLMLQRALDWFGWGDPGVLLSSIVLGAAVYGVFIWWYRPASWSDLMTLIRPGSSTLEISGGA